MRKELDTPKGALHNPYIFFITRNPPYPKNGGTYA